MSVLRPVLSGHGGSRARRVRCVYVLAPRASATIRIGVEKLRQAREWAGSHASKAASTVTSAVNHANGGKHESV